MKHCLTALALAIGVLFGCGSPEEYQKQGTENKEGAVEFSVGLELGAEHRDFGRQALQSVAIARARYTAGDTLVAIHTMDSLIAWAEPLVDTLPFSDPRTSFLVVLLTDIYPQVISWQQQRGYASDVQRRTENYQALGLRFRHRRDSVDRVSQ